MRKVVLGLTFLIIPLTISGCTIDNNQVNDSLNQISSTTNETVNSTDQEMDKYAEFEARFACDLAKAGEEQDGLGVLDSLGGIGELANEFNYTQEDIDQLVTKYEENSEFISLVASKMQEICPEYIQ